MARGAFQSVASQLHFTICTAAVPQQVAQQKLPHFGDVVCRWLRLNVLSTEFGGGSLWPPCKFMCPRSTWHKTKNFRFGGV